MNIEEMKKNKFRNIVLVILFATIVILGLNNSVYASNTAEIKTISGNYTWNVSGKDYEYAKVIETVYNLSGDDLKNQTLPSDKPELEPGYCLGTPTGVANYDPDSIKNSFNVCSTIGNVDTSTYGDYFVQSVCIHPTRPLGTAANKTYVQKVLFISKEQLTLYYKKNLHQEYYESENVYTNDYSEYFDKILQEAYKAMNIVNCADHLRAHLAHGEFQEKIRKCGIDNWDLTASYFSSNCDTVSDEYNYYGIFIFVGTGSDGSQGRIIFNVYREKKSHPIKLSLEKQSFDGAKALGNAEIQIYDTDNGATEVDGLNKDYGNGIYGLVSGNDGKFGEIEIKPANYDAGKVTIKVKEVKAPCGYFPINGEIELSIDYNTSDGSIESVEVPEEYENFIEFNKGEGKLIIKNPKEPEYFLEKFDSVAETRIDGIKFEITEVNIWTSTHDFVTSVGDSLISTSASHGVDIISETLKQKVLDEFDGTNLEIWLKVKENDHDGYINSFGNKTIVLKYDGCSTSIIGRLGWSSPTDSSWYYDNSEATFSVKNMKKLPIELKLKKIDSLTEASLEGVTFDIELDNIEGYETIKRTTDSSGLIELKNLEIKDVSKNITITLREHEKEGYRKLDDIVITLKREGDKYTIVNSTPSDVVSIDGHTVTLTIKNTPVINLSGQVWLDGQQGEKNVEPPNGLKNPNEKGIKGVKVHLYSNKDGKIIATTTTSADGTYNFSDVTKTEEGYKVYFEYNGIIYDDVGITQDSKAAENISERNELNGNFKTIDKYGANGSKYGAHNASYFKNYVDGSQPEGAAIKAYTSETYRETTENIDCGLLEKYFDLSVGTDVSYAEVSINGEKTKYNYALVRGGELRNLKPFEGTSSDKTEYTLYLYKSDYNYRIEDYKPASIPNKVNPEDNYVNPKEYDNLHNLEVYVTYSVDLINQSYHNATVTKFEYVYDEAFEPYNIPRTDKYEVDVDENNRKITFTSIGDGLSVNEPDYINQIDLTFKVKKNTEGNVILKEGFRNTVQILEYSTNEGGLIDDDSVPGNGIDNEEDDWDEAPTFNIKFKEEARTIEGTVFEDANKNGDNDDKTPVNDVIVQLIELKTIKGKYYEYIWQETKSGSNKVKTTTERGYEGKNYNNEVTENGKYKFKDFIPGNYIIRFIYGDGSTYDITTDEYKNSADNVKKYNGQDYKSTIDNSYKEEWYNQANYNGKSVARDNEARRLEVMAYSTTINNDIGEKINKKEKEMLDATWMCAETSKVNVKVDVEGYSNMNFGLALRPQTKLKLEKHITGLKITPQGTGVQPIVDAKISKDQILNNLLNTNEITIEGMRTNLSAIKSNRNEKGFWKVETDIEELAQGAKLEIEFNYVVINESEEDYLSNALVDDYKTVQDTNDMNYYNKKLKAYKTEIKDAMKDGTYSYSNNNIIGRYLGQFYYNGSVNEENEKAVPSAVSSIEDIINTDFKLSGIESENCFEQEPETSEKHKYNADKKLEKAEKIATIKNKNGKATKTIIKDKNATEENKYTSKNTDYSLIAKLETTLSSANKEIYYSDGLAQIMQYTNAAGRKDMEATPGNLKYVGSDAKELTLDSYVKYAENGDIIDVSNEPMEGYAKLNEDDEYWGGTGETLIVSKPTGEDKQTSMQIVIIAISSIAVIGVGIILVKKFVLKK